MFFDERVTTLWCFGAVLIVVGMWLLSSVAIIEQDQRRKMRMNQND